MLLVVLRMILYAKRLLMKLIFESLRTYTSQFLGLMLASYIRIRCVNPCPTVIVRVGISIHRQADSHFDKTKPVALKK